MSREIGDSFEDEIVNHLNGIRKTSNSGAKFSNGDLANTDYILEAKVKNTLKNFSPDKKELAKLKKQADTRLKNWIYAQRTSGGDFVLMELSTFIEIWNKAFDD